MQIDLHRTFSTTRELSDDVDDWSEYLGAKGKLTWSDLHDKPLVVVVGEAGIGKTIELTLQARRLRGRGKRAYFLALNQLTDLGSWDLALADSLEDFQQWKSSDEIGYFLFDAVDEARLTGHVAFVKALQVAQSALRGSFARVRIVISSRITDWSLQGVRDSVDAYLSRYIDAVISVSRPSARADIGNADVAVAFDDAPADEPTTPLIVSLDALSALEAKRLADAFDVKEAKGFWDAVNDGGYGFMATRPLDLRWMVDLWNDKRALGTYLELIECNIGNRLTEVNPSYLAAHAVMSPDILRAGAEELAAATELTGRAYISTGLSPTAIAGEISVASALPDWKPDQVGRLLASAVFDEASFGRVRFHHRSTRAYLAACWVKRQLGNGVPFSRVLDLLAASPFGTTVLIPNRRWLLSWLACVDVQAREWVTQYFPEMLLFDGDPEAWDEPSATMAFKGYVQRLREGLRTDWHNDPSEFLRFGRRLPAGLVAAVLSTPHEPVRVRSAMLLLAKYGRLTDCADPVFAIYRSSSSTERDRRLALEVLASIETPQQRQAIQDDLLAGTLDSNALIACALESIDWSRLSVEQLAGAFGNANSEDKYGAGPMARSIVEDLLPVATVASAELLTNAVLHVLPWPAAGERFARLLEAEQPKRAWLLEVLPTCLETLLQLLPPTTGQYPAACCEAAKRIEALRDSGFADRDAANRIHTLLTTHHKLRWQIGLEIGRSEDIAHSTSRLTWGMSSIVSFGANDVSELVRRANDALAQMDERTIWFEVGMEVAFRGLRGRPRRDALTALSSGPEGPARTARIAEQRARWLEGAKTRRGWKAQERARAIEAREQQFTNQRQLQSNLESIRDGTHRGALHWLIQFSYDRAGRKNFGRIDYGLVSQAFGAAVGGALAAGVNTAWATTELPNPTDYKDGKVPWSAITALAGLNTLFDGGRSAGSLTGLEAGRAARLAVWELNGPPSWFASLAKANSAAVADALHPWIRADAEAASDAHHFQRALQLALHCESGVRAALLAPLVPEVVAGTIEHEETPKQVFRALRADGLIAGSVVVDICRSRVVSSESPDGEIGAMAWLRTWLEEDPVSAWDWFEAHLALHASMEQRLVTAFARIAADCKWVTLPVESALVDVLVRLYALLAKHLPAPDVAIAPEDAGTFGHVLTQMHSSIPNVLVRSAGLASHQALLRLADTAIDPDAKQWLRSQVGEHAMLEAGEAARLEPTDLKTLGSPFITAPRTEAQLFEQVMARLEELRKGVEEGPFSDRDLFKPGMPEKHLQRWIAARLRDTQNRRFSVHREEELDDDKMPDVQLSCQQGSVCVEVKPLDQCRTYSANSLAGTLRKQLVGQYLKGFNSAHGILVLFRLDTKTWDIPGGNSGQPFSALVEYLQAEADAVRAECSGVQVLRVFGIDCIVHAAA